MTTVKSNGRAGRILVAGGYGAVGAEVTRTLAEWFPGRVAPGGRDESRARAHGGVRLDVSDADGFRKALDDLGDIAVVVLCVEPADAAVARLCLERGIHLVDVGATRRLLDAVGDLHGLAVGTGATAVLSVGVAPGLTNLLARRVHDAVGGAERLDITVLLGSGERHGADALRWTVDGLAEPAPARPTRTALPGYGTRTAHPFPFSDQHTLRRTLGVPEATTRLCLDSRPLTASLFALRRAGLLRGARRPRLQRLLTGLFSRVHIGGDGFAVRVDAHRGDRHAAQALTGREQSRVTGLTAAYVARGLLTEGVPAGVHHIEQLSVFADLPERLGAHGVTLRPVTATGG
ncbi:saccharopine dehydrogenase family protein [Streptomyces sp. MUM 178J]|uniref:saccharopine dehydrogenase family protein n=1 Tax=Streptomyces sp. MUM 178J TaxID=2791991 RepID=UPI001F04DEE2|nr:saccharopine dehydrogenase NADP-binding domain-containing protein [Streptomyces sp. MUM 178J]WRQ82318.1 saccharopine dehydrogenase NADP-binding domain-containing protein [Streptomyces sp. MUM 178J]